MATQFPPSSTRITGTWRAPKRVLRPKRRCSFITDWCTQAEWTTGMSISGRHGRNRNIAIWTRNCPLSPPERFRHFTKRRVLVAPSKTYDERALVGAAATAGTGAISDLRQGNCADHLSILRALPPSRRKCAIFAAEV